MLVAERGQIEAVMAARLRLLAMANTHSLAEMLRATIDEAEALTDSHVGYCHLVASDQLTLSLQVWSTNTTRHMYGAEGTGLHYSVNQAGVWGDCIDEPRPIVHNDYSSLPYRRGLPEGHALVIRELVVPVLRGNAVVAALGVGNKLTDYSERDLETIALLAGLAWDIAESKRAQGAPQECELRYRTLADHGRALIWRANVDKKCDYFNQPWLDFTGRSIEQELGDGWAEGVHPEDLERCVGFYSRAFDQREPFSLEYRLRRFDGEFRWLQDDGMPRYDHQGRFLGYVGHCLDVTERKRAEEALRESERQYRELFESSSDALFLIDTDTDQIIDANDMASTVYGYGRVELLTKKSTDMSAEPEDTDRRVKEAHARPGATFRIPLRLHRKKDGTVFPVEITARSFVRQERVLLLVSSRDITERKQAEEALLESERQLLESQKVAGLGSYTLEILTGAWKSSVVLDEIFGIDDNFERSVEGWVSLIHPEWREGMTEYFANEVLRQHVRFDREYKIVRRNGGQERWVHGRGELEFDAGGRPIRMLGTILDITERKRAEEERATLQAQLYQAQKMESIGRLAGGVAHDFNNILTVVNGYSQMLLSQLGPGDPLRDALAQIYTAGERAAGLTSQLLAFSRKQVLEPRRINVNRLVEEMRPMLARLVGEDIELSVALCAESGTIYADSHQLEQMLMNLVVNARDAIPGNGKLLVGTANVERDESYARSHLEARVGRYIMLSVSDTGVGMDEKTKNRIFEPFFTTKGTGKGTGLGLSMVQGIVAQSGGHIEVSSEQGHGTSFKIYLPVLAEGAADAGRAAAVPALGGDETLLVVEDQTDVRQFTVAVLRSYGYRVIPVEHPDEALMLCERELIDLVVTDVVMPHVSGRDLAARLETLRPGIKVLFMSGYIDNVIQYHGVQEESARFIQKPFSPEDLARKVRAVLGPPAH